MGEDEHGRRGGMSAGKGAAEDERGGETHLINFCRKFDCTGGVLLRCVRLGGMLVDLLLLETIRERRVGDEKASEEVLWQLACDVPDVKLMCYSV